MKSSADRRFWALRKRKFIDGSPSERDVVCIRIDLRGQLKEAHLQQLLPRFFATRARFHVFEGCVLWGTELHFL